MLKKNSEPAWGNPTLDQEAAFSDLREAFASPQILALSKRNRPFVIVTETRKYAMAATFLQQQDFNDEKIGRQLDFGARPSLTQNVGAETYRE